MSSTTDEFDTPLCLICEGAERVRQRRYREFPWVCDACLPHLDEAEVICTAVEHARRALLGEQSP